MSILVLPSRGRPISFLKPERVAPSRDELPGDWPRGRLSNWWRKLLGGRDNWAPGLPGSCCPCGSPTCTFCCLTCNLTTLYPTVHVTDSAGTTSCAASGTSWIGCTTVAVPGSAPNSTPCSCNSGSPTTGGSVQVIYTISCTGANTLQVDRSWGLCHSFCYYCTDTFPPGNCTSPNTVNCGGSLFTCSGPGGGLTYANDVGSASITTCNPWPVTLTMTLGNPCGTLVSPMTSSLVINL